LAVNAAQDATDLVAKLRAFHNEAQVNPDRKNLKWQVSGGEACQWGGEWDGKLFRQSREQKLACNKV